MLLIYIQMLVTEAGYDVIQVKIIAHGKEDMCVL